MTWHGRKQFRWVLEKFSPRGLVNLIIAFFLLLLFLVSYFILRDAVETIKHNPEYGWIFKNLGLLSVIVVILFLLLTWEAGFYLSF